MSLQSITQVNVDFYNNKYITISAKQYDKASRFLEVTCYDHGTLFPINSNKHSACIRYKKADGYSVLNLCEIKNNKILVELTEQMLAVSGVCYADLIVINKDSAVVNVETGDITVDNSSILSTMVFCIHVYESAVENSEIESSYEFNELNLALEQVNTDFRDVVLTAKSYAVGGTNKRENEDTDNAKYYSKLSADSQVEAYMSAYDASISMAAAMKSAEDSAASAESANKSEVATLRSESAALISELAAKGYASTAQNSMNSAVDSATSASESASNAYNYYLQTETITNGLNGAFSPKGTITFAELLELKNNSAIGAGDLYHISDNFTTDENFRVSGKECGAGTSVYYTVDSKFDYFIGTTVAGVKGENETGYRTGMVNITPENIGAIASDDIATVDEVKNYLGI